MIELIVPPKVSSHAAYGDELDHAPLHPQEVQAVARAVPKRRGEYAAGRACARAALTALGAAPGGEPVAIGRDAERGAPVWPAGVVGSITHCDGYRAAAVARTADVLTLGIDAEPHGPLPEGVLDAIVSTPDERAALAALLDRVPEVHWDRLLFSAKETVYKAWYPYHRQDRMLGFQEAELLFARDAGDPARGSYTARLLRPGAVLDEATALDVFRGRWLVRKGLVATAIVVPATDRAAL